MTLKLKQLATTFICLLPAPFIKPSLLRLLGHRVNSGAKIGFSLVIVDFLYLGENAKIGNFNIIKIGRIVLHTGSRIGSLNVLKGRFDVVINSKAAILRLNLITRGFVQGLTFRPKLYLGNHSQLTSFSSVDLTSTVRIGEDTVLGGKGIQIWTHGFIHMPNRERVLILGKVSIGDNVYIGAMSCISAGVTIASEISIGAHSSVGSNLIEPGVYVSAPLRHLVRQPDERLSRFEKIPVNGAELIYRKST